jgi:2,4-dienoyl-CoA reductase-like NADH-dependent reductase (Old Yellow Enzyme family)
MEHTTNNDSPEGRSMTLLRRIEAHLASQHISASRFGRAALGDPCFVHDLRRGRTPRPATVARVAAFLEGGELCRS